MSAGSLVLYDFVLPRICPPAVLHGLYDPKAAAAHHKALTDHSQHSRSGGRGHGAGGAVSEHQPLLLEVQLSGDLSAGEDTRHSGTCYSDTCHVGAAAGTPGTSGPEGVREGGVQPGLEEATGSCGSLGMSAHSGGAAAGSYRSSSPGASGHGGGEARALLLAAGGAVPALPVSVSPHVAEAGAGTEGLRRPGAGGAVGGGSAVGRGGLGGSAGCEENEAAAAGGEGDGDGDDVPPPRLWRCISLCWPLCGCLFATYVATLSIFPGFLAEDIHVSTSTCSCVPYGGGVLGIAAYGRRWFSGRRCEGPDGAELEPWQCQSVPCEGYARELTSMLKRMEGGGLTGGGWG